MFAQARFCNKSSAALVARKWPVARMRFNMVFQVRKLGEFSFACVAFEASLPRMRANVFVQIAVDRKLLAADFAAVWFLSGVFPVMHT